MCRWGIDSLLVSLSCSVLLVFATSPPSKPLCLRCFFSFFSISVLNCVPGGIVPAVVQLQQIQHTCYDSFLRRLKEDLGFTEIRARWGDTGGGGCLRMEHGSGRVWDTSGSVCDIIRTGAAAVFACLNRSDPFWTLRCPQVPLSPPVLSERVNAVWVMGSSDCQWSYAPCHPGVIQPTSSWSNTPSSAD